MGDLPPLKIFTSQGLGFTRDSDRFLIRHFFLGMEECWYAWILQLQPARSKPTPQQATHFMYDLEKLYHGL